jgi:hypothetical protein
MLASLVNNLDDMENRQLWDREDQLSSFASPIGEVVSLNSIFISSLSTC